MATDADSPALGAVCARAKEVDMRMMDMNTVETLV